MTRSSNLRASMRKEEKLTDVQGKYLLSDIVAQAFPYTWVDICLRVSRYTPAERVSAGDILVPARLEPALHPVENDQLICYSMQTRVARLYAPGA